MKSLLLAIALGALTLAPAQAEETVHFVMAERLEYHNNDSSVLWDFRGTHGGDLRKFAWKTEGHQGTVLDDAEVQLLYRQAWTPYFDWQVGFRQERIEGVNRSSLVLGTEGMSAFNVEIDAALFVTDDGDVLLRAEFERDILINQQWILQPRIEVNASLQDIPDFAADAGFNDLSLDLRLRYEVTRKIAPYIGITYERLFDIDESETSLVAGLRFWF